MVRTIVACLALSLVACGGGSENVPTNTGSTAPTAKTEAAPAKAKVVVSSEVKAVVDAADRSEDDRKLDAGRKPGEMLAFFGIRPGMRVAEIGAGTGYTTELLARAVAPNGTVYGVNNPWVIEKFAKEPWAARLAKPADKNVVSVIRDFGDPFPAEAKDLDAVVSVLIYHDLYWLGPDADRAKMNVAIFKALKPGGVYGIIDHSGRPGTGSSEVKTVHRIEEKTLAEDVLKAGFKLAATADFLRNADDTRDWNASPMAAGERRGHSDRFVLKFIKP